MVGHIDLFEELEEGCLTVGPDHKNVVFESRVSKVFSRYLGVDVFGFEFPHKSVGVRARIFAAHCAAFDLDEVLVINEYLHNTIF